MRFVFILIFSTVLASCAVPPQTMGDLNEVLTTRFNASAGITSYESALICAMAFNRKSYVTKIEHGYINLTHPKRRIYIAKAAALVGGDWRYLSISLDGRSVRMCERPTGWEKTAEYDLVSYIRDAQRYVNRSLIAFKRSTKKQ